MTDMMRGRPAVYATFSSYDEVALHSGLERADTLDALRKLDKQFALCSRVGAACSREYRTPCGKPSVTAEPEGIERHVRPMLRTRDGDIRAGLTSAD